MFTPIDDINHLSITVRAKSAPLEVLVLDRSDRVLGVYRKYRVLDPGSMAFGACCFVLLLFVSGYMLWQFGRTYGRGEERATVEGTASSAEPRSTLEGASRLANDALGSMR